MTYEKLMEMYQKLEKENQNLKVKQEQFEMYMLKTEALIQDLTDQNNELRRMLFGVKRERTSKKEIITKGQISLFENEEEAEATMQEESREALAEITVDNIELQNEENQEAINQKTKKKAKTRKAGIIKERIEEVETTLQIEELKEEAQVCPVCKSKLKEVSERLVNGELVWIPGHFEYISHANKIYKCTKCGQKGSKKETPTFVTAKSANPVLPHSFVSPSLATEVIYSKYYLDAPLYRQEKMWEDRGLSLPRNVMANWIIKISEYYLESLCNLIFKTIKEENVVAHVDETTTQCNKEEGREATSNSYMWGFCSGEEEIHRAVVFKYNPSRSEKVAKDFLKGFKGILVTDGYSSYNNVEVDTHVACWAHLRRYFYNSVPLDEHKQMIESSYGYKGVKYCNKLFAIEREIAEFSKQEKERVRKEKSLPIVEEFYKWIEATNKEKTFMSSKLNKAITYAINQKEKLIAFIEDGRIPLTNSMIERNIRPFAILRKNCLFSDSVAGAKASAVMYSIVQTAKMNNLNITEYLNYLLQELPQLDNPRDEAKLYRYLPWSETLPDKVRNAEVTEVAVDAEKEEALKNIIVDKRKN